MTSAHFPRSRVSRAALRLLAAGAVLWGAGLACAAPVQFNLPAQPADSALMALGRQANVELLFSFDELHNVRSVEVTGLLEPEQALNRLLEGTGFIASRNGTGRFAVTPVPRRGSLKGRLLTASGAPAGGIHVMIQASRMNTVTDADGWYEFPSVTEGTYQLVAAAAGYQPLEINEAHVVASRSVVLDTCTMKPLREPAELEPFVVEAKSARAGPLVEYDAGPAPRTAIGDLDQPRSENDALDFTIINRDQIARSGVVNLNEFLQREILDSDATTLPPERNGSANAFSTSSSNLNLRGYGADATIILVNGRRLPEVVTALPANLSTAQAPQSDVNVIPMNLIERVEVLPVSASAIYSGSPIGGVINIVLRPDINTTELTTTYTNALSDFDAPEFTTSLLHGETLLGGRLHLRMNLSVTKVTPATESELGYIKANLEAHPSPESALYRATPNVSSSNGSPLFGPGTASFTSVAPGADGSGGLGAFAGREGEQELSLFAPKVGGLSDGPDTYGYPYGRKMKSGSFFASATYDVSAWLQAGLDFSAGRTVNNTGYNIFAGSLVLPAASPNNPFGQAVNVTLNEETPALGENYDEAHIDYYSMVLGLLFKLRHDWQASLDAQYGLSVTTYRGVAGIDNARWQDLVNEGVYNPLRDTQAFTPPAQFYDQAVEFYGSRGAFVTLGDYDTVDTSLRLTNTSLMLPTGVSTVVVGGDYRYASLQSYVDALRYGDGELVAPPNTWRGRSLQRVSAFSELQAPLVPAAKLPDWIRNVDVDLAARYTASDLANEANTAPTGAIKVDFAGGFTLRGTYATSNTFPPPYFSAIQDANIGTSGAGPIQLTKIYDPRRGQQQEEVLAANATNPNLVPEAAVTQTAGIIYQRGTVHHFRVSLDFVNTVTSGQQQYLSTDQVLDLEQYFPKRVIRATPLPGDPYGVGQVTEILTGNFNLAWRHSYEWTSSLDYAWTDCFGGTLDLYGRMIYFQRYDLKTLPQAPTVDELKAPDGTVPGLLKMRMNFGAGWSNRSYGFGVDGQYFHSRILPQIEWATQGSDEVDPYWQFDAYLQSDLGRLIPWKHPGYGLRGQVRVDNLFGSSPPVYAQDPSGAGVQSYTDWRGRVYSVSLTLSF
ncbi:MAG TPA: TonB-dependent receptor [Opitutaceae bacterium]|nr:TonB-dependent receptor [Opitutaceae bacterium]